MLAFRRPKTEPGPAHVAPERTGPDAAALDRAVRSISERASHMGREAAEVRNQAETLSYSIEKLIKENDDKLPEDVKSEVQGDVDALKTALAGDDDEAVKTAFDKLNQSQGKLGEAIYASSQASQQADAPADEPAGDTGSTDSDEDVVDAEVIDDEDEKK